MKLRSKKWSEMTPGAKTAVVGALVAHFVLVGLAHRDLSHRTQEEVRGPRWMWRMLTASNSTFAGAYFVIGRRGTVDPDELLQ